jgi:hypothetical protein
VRNILQVTSRTLFSGVSSPDMPRHGISSSSTLTEDGLSHLASRTGRLHLARSKLSECARQKLKKARASQAGNGGSQQPGNAGIPKQGETLTWTSKRPRPANSTSMERVTSEKAQRIQ